MVFEIGLLVIYSNNKAIKDDNFLRTISEQVNTKHQMIRPKEDGWTVRLKLLQATGTSFPLHGGTQEDEVTVNFKDNYNTTNDWVMEVSTDKLYAHQVEENGVKGKTISEVKTVNSMKGELFTPLYYTITKQGEVILSD